MSSQGLGLRVQAGHQVMPGRSVVSVPVPARSAWPAGAGRGCPGESCCFSLCCLRWVGGAARGPGTRPAGRIPQKPVPTQLQVRDAEYVVEMIGLGKGNSDRPLRADSRGRPTAPTASSRVKPGLPGGGPNHLGLADVSRRGPHRGLHDGVVEFPRPSPSRRGRAARPRCGTSPVRLDVPPARPSTNPAASASRLVSSSI